jgi:D-aminoacyl-tRNA deacylase
MRAVVQRVKSAEVRVGGQVVGRIGPGLLILVGIAKGDTMETGKALAEKIASLRIFDDEQGKMNRSIAEVSGRVLCVSQFTLSGPSHSN